MTRRDKIELIVYCLVFAFVLFAAGWRVAHDWEIVVATMGGK